MDQKQFDEELGRRISSPVPTLIALAMVVAFVLLAWITH